MDNIDGVEKYEALVKYKRSMLGNMKFVGQLLIRKMLSSKIMFQCVDRLLEVKNEESLETLTVFLTTIGPHYDTPEFQRYDVLQTCFARVKDLLRKSEKASDKQQLSARTKCLLKDVLDLKAGGWRSKGTKNEPEGPMKLADVGKQARRGERAERGERGERPVRETPRVSAPDADEWCTVGRARATAAPRASSGNVCNPTGQSNGIGATAGGGAFAALSKASRKSKEEVKSVKLERPDKVKGSKSDKPKRKKATLEEFEEEVPKIMDELTTSHDVDEAVQRVQDMRLSSSNHAEAVRIFLVHIIERYEAFRAHGLKFLKAVYENAFDSSTLEGGFRTFLTEGAYEDITIDVPKAKGIIIEALASLSELLDADELQKLA